MSERGTTPVEWVNYWCEKTPQKVFLRQPRNGKRLTTTWAEFHEQMLRMAAALRGIGLSPGDRVAILAKNCAEWFVADLAIQAAGLISVPIYPTASDQTIGYVLEHCDAKAIFLGPLDNSAKQRSAIPESTAVIALPADGVEATHEWGKMLAAHEPLETPHIGQPDETMTLVYTSGSTGNPKGVVLTYGNIDYNSRTPSELVGLSSDSTFFSYLPLAHVVERAGLEGASLYCGATVDFNESLETFAADIQYSQPTFFISVPRLWMRFQSKVLANIPRRRLDFLLRIPLVSGWIKRKIRRQLGLSRATLCASGSAPVSADLLHWFERLGVPISEGWGMSETFGVSLGNFVFRKDKLGSIGVPMPGTEVKLSDAGEILIRGPGVFKEYYREPEQTAAAFTDGWFHTGDKAEVDDDGYYYIKGRVKDLFKTGKGKYVVPVPIEGALCANPLIEQVCVMGSGRKQPVAVAVLSAEVSASMSREAIDESLADTLAKVNATLESHSKLDALFIAKEPWTIENGLLTPTLKIKRAELEQKYSALIAAEATDKVVWEQ